MGIIGAGQIGVRVAAAARSAGMVPLGVNRSGRPAPGFDSTYSIDSLHEVMSQVDCVVVTLPPTHEIRGCLDDTALACMRPASYLVNVARGGIIDEEALLRRLRDGPIAGAVLDVFEREPLSSSSGFWAPPNVLISPHVSGEFEGWPEAVARFFCTNLVRWTSCDALANVVDPVAGY
jgi:phosphoglycerate dehydrogenase-like enzyme